MKTITRVCLVLAALLLSAGEVSAQILKWSNPRAAGATYARAGDGLGGIAYVLQGGSTDYAASVTWIAPSGKILLSVEVDRPHEDIPVAIVRMTGRELAIRFLTRLPGEETNSNVLRRYTRTARGITVTDKKLEPGEEMPSVPERLTDAFGFFSFTHSEVRRYSN